ncbi:hypothetical protein ACFYN3_42020 [Streptomyces lavendulae]|uniref:D-alanine--D-alanine ligase family protein n=1 Tax=Streptomyces lavendulae TaxID=1914 RepID=UPI0033CA5054
MARQPSIAFTYDLRGAPVLSGPGGFDDAEFDELETVEAITAALEDLGYRCLPVGSLPALAERLVHGERWDAVFNISEGFYGSGREAAVPALLDQWRIPYTFSGPLSMCICLHKPTAKRLLRDAGVPTAAFTVVHLPDEVDAVDLQYPLFVKPVAEGTAKGVTPASLVTGAKQLRETCTQLLKRYGQPVLVERYLPGPEYTVGVLGAGVSTCAIGVSQMLYPEQWGAFASEEVRDPAALVMIRQRLLGDTSLARHIAGMAVASWRALDCKDAGRIDIRIDGDGNPHVLEVNPLPGLHIGLSYLPVQWELTGRPFRSLIAAIMTGVEQRILAR